MGLKGSQESMNGVKSFLISEMYRAMNVPTQRSSFAKFYINDIYFGLYWLSEELEPNYVESRFNNVNRNNGFFKW
jgi:hypothetical protein